MSKKDFDDYYKTLQEQYNEMRATLEEFELMAMDKVVSPEQVENFKQTLQPIKESYLTLAYVAYLLNKPNKPQKKVKYDRQHLGKLDLTYSKDNITSRNEKSLETLKEKCNG